MSVNFCIMKKLIIVFDHICLCVSIHSDESDGRSVKCSFCYIFYSEICLRNHFCRKLNVHDGCEEHQK